MKKYNIVNCKISIKGRNIHNQRHETGYSYVDHNFGRLGPELLILSNSVQKRYSCKTMRFYKVITKNRKGDIKKIVINKHKYSYEQTKEDKQ